MPIHLYLANTAPMALCMMIAFTTCCLLLLQSVKPFLPIIINEVGGLLLTVTLFTASPHGGLNVPAFLIIPGLFQFIIYMFYIRRTVSAGAVSRLLLLLHQFVPLCVFGLLFYSGDNPSHHEVIYGLQHLFMCVAGLCFFYDLHVKHLNLRISDIPAFWIILGVTIHSLLILLHISAGSSSGIGLPEAILIRCFAAALLYCCFYVALVRQLHAK